MVEAPAQHRHRGIRAVQRMVEFAPATGGLALWVRHQDVVAADRGVAAAAPVFTDGTTLFYRAAFDELRLAEQTGWVAHEVLHIALRHSQRFLDLQDLLGDVDLQLYNLCADAIVNSTLAAIGWLQLPASAVLLEALLAQTLQVTQSAEKSLLEWDVERLYRALDDRGAARGAGQSDRSRPGAGGREAEVGAGRTEPRPDGPKSARARALGQEHSRDLVPDPASRGPPEAEADEVRAWSERILRAHAGDGAHSMLRTLLADVARVRTPWEHVLRACLTRGLAAKLDVSWSRPARSYIANQGRAGPHRRLPWTPGIRRTQSAPRLVVIVDVSGSISALLLQRFSREIEAISRRLETALVLIIGDDSVRDVRRFEPGRADLSRIEFSGGGGTDFTPLFEEAQRHDPDMTVILTDLDGPARYRPRCPVLWAVPAEHAPADPPFGRKLLLA